MDLENQARIKGLADEYGKDLVVVLGAGEAEEASLAAYFPESLAYAVMLTVYWVPF